VDSAYRSKLDIWLVIVLVGLPIVALEFLIDGMGLSDRAINVLALLIVVIVLGMVFWLFLTTRYTLTDEYLLIRCGPFSWAIAFDEITHIEPTRNPYSSPALSLDRLAIRYGGGELLISPADKERFMIDLKKRLKARSAGMES
jgi:hypothetical protein